MNKKFSTLMAAALAAGGLFSSGDLQAQLQYKGETTYETVKNAAVVSAEGKTNNYYLVFQNKEIDYVAIVKNNALIGVPFLEAQKSDMLKIKKIDASNYNIFTAEDDLLQVTDNGLSSGKYKFGKEWPNWTKIQSNEDNVLLQLNKASVKLSNDKFTVVANDGKDVTFEAKLISSGALQKIENPCATVEAETIDFTKSYPIMTVGKVLIVDADGNLVLTNYDPQDKSQFWQPEFVSTGTNAGYALLKNEETGKYMQVGDNKVAIKLTYDADEKGYLFENGFDAFKLYQINGTTFSSLTIKEQGVSISSFALGQVGTMYLTAEDLRSIFGDSFNADIKRTEGNKSLDNNVFVGNLTPVTLEKNAVSGDYTTKVLTNITGDKFMLQNGNGNIIVVTNKKYTVGVDTYGYKLDEVTPRELALTLNGDNDDVTYACWFSINADENFEVGADQTVNTIFVTGEDGTTYKLGALDVEDVPTLAAEVSGSNVVTPITVKLGKFNTVDLTKLLAKPTFFSVTVKNIKKDAENYGKVLGLDEYGNVAYVKASDALVGYPETQWALTVVNDMLVLKNREYPEATTSARIDFTYDPKQMYNVSTNVFAYGKDTLEIKPVETTDYDGFKVLDA